MTPRYSGSVYASLSAGGEMRFPAGAIGLRVGDAFMATRDPEREGLLWFPFDEWEALLDIDVLSASSPEGRHRLRMLMMWAEPVEVGPGWTLPLPPHLTSYVRRGPYVLVTAHDDHLTVEPF